MPESVQQICLGAAAVFDTVLLLALVERRNWPFVRLPIVLMVVGVWIWHAGQFALLLLTGLPGAWPWYAQGLCMLAMTAGLLLMPCGLLHGTWRVLADRLDRQPRPRLRHVLAYAPVLVVALFAPRFFAPDRIDFVTATSSVALPYLLFVANVNLLAAGVFLRARRRHDSPPLRSFLFAMAGVLLGLTVFELFIMLIARPAWPDLDSLWMLAISLSPVAPALLFTYFVIRYNFLQLIVERSLVYGAILGSILLLHQLAFQDVSRVLPESYRLHVVILEAVVLTALVLIYQPFRQRSAEALRYLLGQRVAVVRERFRQLSRELSAQAGRAPADLLRWFVEALRDALQVEYVAGWLFDSAGTITVSYGDSQRLRDDLVRRLYERLRHKETMVCSRRRAADLETLHSMQAVAASLALVKVRPNVSGLLVLGRGPRHRDLSEEETNAVLLLVEQLAITLDNSVLQAERLAAERRAMQSEKLSALGLMASSIAHEVKNPLSAIKTIATVLSEDLGQDSPHAEDIRLILGEVDRLAATTAQLLEVARPRSTPRSPGSVPEVLTGTLRLLRHLAREQDIAIETHLEDVPPVQADEQALREIFFNLLSNSLEAAGPGGRVEIACQRENGFVVTQVRDSGPGIADDVRGRLFEPFLTTKATGTGLGLYVVGRRVNELGGVIICDSGPARGTSFTVKLPSQTP
jgi:signal transduction histidine kinase